MSRNKIKQRVCLAAAMIISILVSGAPVCAEATIHISLVAQTNVDESMPVPGVLCEVSIDGETEEIWTDTKGLITLPATSAMITIVPVVLPMGFGYLRNIMPVLELESKTGQSIPKEGELPPQIELAVTKDAHTLSFSVKDERGQGVINIGITISSKGGLYHKTVKTDSKGEAALALGAGLYEIEVTEYPKAEYQTPEPLLRYLIEDNNNKIVLLDLMPDTPIEPSSNSSEPVGVDASEKTIAKTQQTEGVVTKAPTEIKVKSKIDLLQIIHLLLTVITLLGVTYLVLVNISLRRNF